MRPGAKACSESWLNYPPPSPGRSDSREILEGNPYPWTFFFFWVLAEMSVY